MTEVADICDRAADLIRERGWCQKRLQNDNGAVCLSGAMALAINGSPHKTVADDGTWLVKTETFCAVKCVLADKGHFDLPSKWNDRQGRTQDEVIALLRETASKWRLE